MKLLLVGGAGYLGTKLGQLLQQKGVELSILDKQPSYLPNISSYLATSKDTDTLARSMKGCSAVYHLAWRYPRNESVREPFHLVSDNLLSLTNTLCTAVRLGIDKVIFTSSYEVYGNVVSAHETDPTIPVSMNGSLKLAAESICKGFYSKGLDIVILRLGEVWEKESLEFIQGDGQHTRDYLHVSDAVDALARAYDWGSSIYNIGTDEETTENALWKLSSSKEPTYKGEPDILRNSLCNEFVRLITGWHPKVLVSKL